MGDTFFENLFYKQEKQFEKINDLSKAFAVNSVEIPLLENLFLA